MSAEEKNANYLIKNRDFQLRRIMLKLKTANMLVVLGKLTVQFRSWLTDSKKLINWGMWKRCCCSCFSRQQMPYISTYSAANYRTKPYCYAGCTETLHKFCASLCSALIWLRAPLYSRYVGDRKMQEKKPPCMFHGVSSSTGNVSNHVERPQLIRANDWIAVTNNRKKPNGV